MIRARCPYCYRHHTWPDVFAETTVKCPNCARFYNADPLPAEQPRPSVEPVAAPLMTTTQPRRLTAPHACLQCLSPLDLTAERHRLSLPCPHCRRATSILAVLHRCPACDARLESPASSTGNTTRCPACGSPLEVPADLLRPERGYVEERVLAFECGRCDGRVLASREAVGLRAVCPHCERPLTVPAIGEVPRDHERRPGFDGLTSHCSHCHLEIPRHAERCPFCEAGNPFDS